MFATRHAFFRRNCSSTIIRTMSVRRLFPSDIKNNLWKSQNDSNSLQIVRNYAFKSDLKIKWVRPQKIPCYKPEKSGDLEQLPPLDEKQFAPDFSESQELKSADDLVKRLFTLEFNPRKTSMMALKKNIVSRVQRHNLDVGSAETRIAKMTAGIRNIQEVMEDFPRNKTAKVNLKELIDRRKKFLKYLRRWDYKRFEWLLEKLNLVYKPPPSKFHWITRKDSLRKLTDKHCEELKEQKLAAYKATLEAQKVDFLQEKIEKLLWIRREEEECGIEPTVSKEDIERVRMQLKEIEISKKENVKTI